MNRNIFAYTVPGSEYPGYVSINREPDGNVTVTVRAAPIIHEDSIYICGFRTDKDKPGRCTPGDAHCNNYCNLAPEKGPMQDHPKHCRQVHEGKTVSYTVPAIDWDRCFTRASPQPCTDCAALRDEKDRLNNLLLETADRHAHAIVALELEVERLRAALTRLRDCDWAISLPDRMDAVRDIARAALNGGKHD